MMQIENQGRHSGEGFRELADDLWANKPVLIVLGIGLFLVVYLIAKYRNDAIAAPNPGTPNPAGSNGTYLAVFDESPPAVNVTVNSPPTTQSGSGGTSNPPHAPIGGPIVPGLNSPPGTIHPIVVTPTPAPTNLHPLTGSPKTVTVPPGANLSSIAQAHGVNEQQLYNLNKAKIGPNPNLIHPGMVLTLPK